MGVKADEPIQVSYEEFKLFLRSKHSCYLKYGDKYFYVTDVNDSYWRLQDTRHYNEKGHYIDCSDLVPTLAEFLNMPLFDGKSIKEVFDKLTIYESIKE